MLNSRILILFSAFMVLLGSVSNALGNVVASKLPPGVLPFAPIIFGTALAAEFCFTFYLSYEEAQQEKRRVAVKWPVTLIVMVVIFIAAVVDGLASNSAATELSGSLHSLVLKNSIGLFIAVNALALFFAILLAFPFKGPSGKSKKYRTDFQTLLHERYERRKEIMRSEVELLLADTDEKTLDATLEDIRPRLIDRQTKEEYKESIDSIFRTRSKGKLLILGEAGAGKTTYLVELALALVWRMVSGGDDRFPVIFSLASWGPWAKDRSSNNRSFSLVDWMIDELSKSYGIPHHIARDWVEDDKILPLLDGLNEVTLQRQHRDECIQAIERFQDTHKETPLVVCHRIDTIDTVEQDAQLQRLNLPEVKVMPLTPQRIDEFLKRGNGLDRVRDALKARKLQSLVTTPLILIAAAFAYQDNQDNLNKFPTAIPPLNDIPGASNTWLRLLWEKYVERMVERKHGKAELGRVKDDKISIGSPREQRKLKRKLERERSKLPKDITYPLEDTRRYLEWLAAEMKKPEHNPEIFYLEDMQWDWLPTPPERKHQLIKLTGNRRLSAPPLLLGLGVVCIVALMIGVPIGMFVDSTHRLGNGMIYGARYGLEFGVAFGLLGFAFAHLGSGKFGFEHGNLNLKNLPHPGAGIQQSRRNGRNGAILVGLAYILGVGLTYGLGVAVVGGFAVALSSSLGTAAPGIGLLIGFGIGILLGIPSAFLAWDELGGSAYTSFQALQRQLELDKVIPENYIQFLDYAEDRVLLRRSGRGGYSFFHGLLQDYFAEEWEKTHKHEHLPIDSIALSDREVVVRQP